MPWLPAAWPSTGSANRHSRRVALLKRVLPATGVALLLLIAIWPRLAPLWEGMRLAWPAIDLRDARQLRMVNLHYAGIDRQGRPFVLSAASGRQVPDRQDLMSLEAPRAEMKTHGGANVVITAASGIYQSQTQLIDLFGSVTIVRQDGTRFVTDAARVDAAHNSAEGSDPVEGHGPSGDVKAEGFRIVDKGDTVLFTGRSDMLVKGARPGTQKSTPPRLPAPIATAAARVAVEAKPALAAAAPRPAVTRHATSRRGHTASAASGHKHHAPARGKPAHARKG
ncbi:MAG TPA: LPS export ABC transporter periplasmic protein LptC [Stellaceae bacterium]|nr:LPS export ABC transporter periplasmic protein LptC [Stellaceae bacterium]